MGDIMDIKDIEKLYLHRQSCRSFDLERPVSDELLREVCRLALLAPSACNSQPWKLLAVTGEKAKQLATGVQDLGMNKFASDAPAFIVVLEDTGNLTATVGSRFKNTDFLHNDIGIMTAHLVLAAEAAGLATCILGWRSEEKLRAALEKGVGPAGHRPHRERCARTADQHSRYPLCADLQRRVCGRPGNRQIAGTPAL